MEERLRYLEKLRKRINTSNIGRPTGEFLAFLMQAVQPKKILEIGTSTGYSALWLSQCGAEVHTIDKSADRVEIAEESFAGTDIVLHVGEAFEIIPTLEGPFDVLFIDGTAKEYLQYFELAREKLATGALVIADNTLSHKEKLQDFLDYIHSHYDVTDLDLGKGLSLFFYKGL